MSRRRKLRADGSPVPRSCRSPRSIPTAEEIEALETFTSSLPEPLRAFRDLSLLSPRRRLALERAIANRTRSLCLVLYGVHDPHNQAAVIRTSEALGLQELHVVEAPGARWKPSERVTQSANRWVDVVAHASFETAAEHLRGRGKRVMAAALVDGAAPLRDLDTTIPSAFVLGSEAKGLPEEVLQACDGCFSIPLYGLTTALNVSVAAAVIATHAVEVRAREWGGPGDLDELGQMELRRRFYERAAGRLPPSLKTRLDALSFEEVSLQRARIAPARAEGE